MACTDSFLIVVGKWGETQPEPISHEAALKHWREGTAKFRPFAEKVAAEVSVKTGLAITVVHRDIDRDLSITGDSFVGGTSRRGTGQP
jgi:hypothetical protein